MTLQHLTSRLGKPQLLFDGFRYVKEVKGGKAKNYWRCIKYDSDLRCRGRCVSVKDTAWSTADHNHSPTNNEDQPVSNPSQYVSTSPSVFSAPQKQFHNASTQQGLEDFTDASQYSSAGSYTDDSSNDAAIPSGVPGECSPGPNGSDDSYTDEESNTFENSKDYNLKDGRRKPGQTKVAELSERMWRARPYLEMLITQDARLREIILMAAGTETINSLVEFCNSILNSSIPMSCVEKSCLIQYKRIIRKIADPRTKTSAKIRILQSKPDFITPLLSVVDKFLLKNGFNVLPSPSFFKK
jgi:hypothetical protein